MNTSPKGDTFVLAYALVRIQLRYAKELVDRACIIQRKYKASCVHDHSCLLSNVRTKQIYARHDVMNASALRRNVHVGQFPTELCTTEYSCPASWT